MRSTLNFFLKCGTPWLCICKLYGPPPPHSDNCVVSQQPVELRCGGPLALCSRDELCTCSYLFPSRCYDEEIPFNEAESFSHVVLCYGQWSGSTKYFLSHILKKNNKPVGFIVIMLLLCYVNELWAHRISIYDMYCFEFEWSSTATHGGSEVTSDLKAQL